MARFRGCESRPEWPVNNHYVGYPYWNSVRQLLPKPSGVAVATAQGNSEGVVTALAEVFWLGTAKVKENLAFRRYLSEHHYSEKPFQIFDDLHDAAVLGLLRLRRGEFRIPTDEELEEWKPRAQMEYY